jgi:hypothetical protein
MLVAQASDRQIRGKIRIVDSNAVAILQPVPVEVQLFGFLIYNLEHQDRVRQVRVTLTS